MSYELCSQKFSDLLEKFQCLSGEDLNEADTRLKIIDEIFFECLGWSKDGVTVENHVHEGYLDYKFGASGHRFLVEAKKVGRTFSLPDSFGYEKNLTVKSTIKKQKDLKEVYEQAIKYAQESAIPFCIITNGCDWVIFPGLRTDGIPLRESKVILFAGLESIENNFLEFWGLLSYSSVANGSLEKNLYPEIGSIRSSYIYNSEGRLNIPYDRNILAPIMTQLLSPYFGDLLFEDSDESNDMDETDEIPFMDTQLLEACYVSDANMSEILESIGDSPNQESISTTIKSISKARQFSELNEVSKKLHSLLVNFLSTTRNEYSLQVILGRVGIGKTTFLGHFFKVKHKEIDEKQFVLKLNFHDVTEDTNIEEFFEETLWRLVSRHSLFKEYSSHENLRKVLHKDIEAQERGPLAMLKVSNREKYEEKISDFLFEKFNNKIEFAEKLTTYLRRKIGVRVIFIFDNVDQLNQQLQEKVILYAYAQTRRFKAFSIISMWEETFFAMKTSGRALATMSTQPLEMVRQGIIPILNKRLEFVVTLLERDAVSYLDESICSKDDLISFLRLMLRSLTVDNKQVRSFLEFIALGNIRSALELFLKFMSSGSLETYKILQAMRHESYLVPIHEFVKSVMLGSKRYFSERNSGILNLFGVGDMEAPSHFTRLRILQYLYDRRHEAGEFGHGFVQLTHLALVFKSIGISEKDLNQSLAAMTSKGLVENELHALRNNDYANSVRITATGRYYLTNLKNIFIYLDLVWQETPIFDKECFNCLVELADSTDMYVRFQRCGLFIDYLAEEESSELSQIKNFTQDEGLLRSHMSDIKSFFEYDKVRISHKIERRQRMNF